MDMDTESKKLAEEIQGMCANHTHGAALYALCVVLGGLLGTVPRNARLKVADKVCERLRDGLVDSLSDRD
jgi:hypothetical protein